MVLALASGCSEVERGEHATEVPAEPAAISPLPSSAVEVNAAKPLPVLGDPYGLLSRPTQAPAKRAESVPIGRLDPGALTAATSSQPVSSAPEAERDPRAVDRANATPRFPRSRPSMPKSTTRARPRCCVS